MPYSCGEHGSRLMLDLPNQKGCFMLPTYAFGFDPGNAETGAVLFDPEQGYLRDLTLPSATAPGRLADLARVRSGLGLADSASSVALSRHEYVLNFEDIERFVGELALTQARDGSTARGDIGRYWSRRALHLLLTASGALIAPDQPEYELFVVTGLPIETFNAETRKKVKVALEGHYTFVLNGARRVAHIRVPSIIMEGAGALIAYGANGSPTQGCIDVGGRTTDLFVAQGQQPILPLCHGRPVGIETAGDALSRRFETLYGRPLHLAELRSLLRSYVQSKSDPLLQSQPSSVYANGVEVPFSTLSEWCETLFRETGADIATFVGTAWNSSATGAVGADIARVILVGGGAYYVADALRQRIPHLFVPQRPELANATGYGALAQQLLRQAKSREASAWQLAQQGKNP